MTDSDFNLTADYNSNPDTILIRFGELYLKKGNQPLFISQLKENIEERLAEFKHGELKKLRNGFLLDIYPHSNLQAILEHLQTVAGIAWFAPAWKLPRNLETIASAALKAGAPLIDKSEKFAICCSRADKEFSKNSVQCNTKIGAVINESTELGVDLDEPDLEIYVRILHNQALLFFHKFDGFRGLPVETSGAVLTLLSGGIDSPVAALRILSRGCRTDFLHFYNYSSAREALEHKLRALVNHLAGFGTRGKLYLVPDLPFELVSRKFPANFKMVLFRRHLTRVADKICKKNNLGAIVTGESLGQVASQTLENLTTISSPTSRPVLRPLVGMNKEEISGYARRWGSYNISIDDYKDCCSILARHPRTKTSPTEASKLEKKIDLKTLDNEALDQATTITYDVNGLDPLTDGEEI